MGKGLLLKQVVSVPEFTRLPQMCVRNDRNSRNGSKQAVVSQVDGAGHQQHYGQRTPLPTKPLKAPATMLALDGDKSLACHLADI